MSARTRSDRIPTRRKGLFTTLELLIVLAVIGFFVAMIGPKLVGVIVKSQERIDDGNLDELASTVSRWQSSQPGQFPNSLLNAVYFTGDDASLGNHTLYLFPSMAEKNQPQDGAEWLSYSFVQRVRPYLHQLSSAEVDELRGMGITRIVLLERDTAQGTQREVDLVPGMRVMMVGAGKVSDGPSIWYCHATPNNYSDYGPLYALPQADESGSQAIPVYGEDGIAYPDLLYRILLAVGPECELLTDGTLANAPQSPVALSESDHYKFGYYFIVLPRLRATVAQVNPLGPTFIRLPKLVRADYDHEGVSDRREWVTADIQGEAEQTPGQFTVLSPEGYRLDDQREANWDIDNSASGTIYTFYPTP